MKKIILITSILYFTSITAQEYGVLTTDGQMMTGELISLNKEGIKLKSKYGVIDVKADSIMMITGLDNLFSKEIEDEIHQLEKDLESLQSSMNPSKIIPEKEIKEKEPRVKFIPYDDPPRPKKQRKQGLKALLLFRSM